MSEQIASFLPEKRERQIVFVAAILGILTFAYLTKRSRSAAVNPTLTQTFPVGNLTGGAINNNGITPASTRPTILATLKFALGFTNSATYQAARNSAGRSANSTGFNIFGINLGGLGFSTGSGSSSASASATAYSGSSGYVNNSEFDNLTPDQVDKVLAFMDHINQLYFANAQQHSVAPSGVVQNRLPGVTVG